MIYAGALYFIGFAFCVNSLFYIWRFKNTKSLILGYLLLFLGILIFNFGLTISGHLLAVPFLFGSYALICSVVHSLYILAIIYFFSQNFHSKKKYWLLFAFPIIQIVLYIPYLLLPQESQIQIIHHTLQNGNLNYFHSEASFYIHILLLAGLYLFALIRIGKAFQWGKTSKKYKIKVRITLAIVYVCTVIFFSIDLISIGRYASNSTSSASRIVTEFSVTFLFFVFFQVWPYYFKHGFVFFDPKTFKVEKYLNRYLDDTNIEEIEKSLQHLIQVEKLHQDEDINSASIAKSLGISVHQLSAYLNQHLHQKFSDFINSKRIEDAKEILQKYPEKNVLEICYELGYNSPATFYKAFKRETGCSPKEWLKKK